MSTGGGDRGSQGREASLERGGVGLPGGRTSAGDSVTQARGQGARAADWVTGPPACTGRAWGRCLVPGPPWPPRAGAPALPPPARLWPPSPPRLSSPQGAPWPRTSAAPGTSCREGSSWQLRGRACWARGPERGQGVAAGHHRRLGPGWPGGGHTTGPLVAHKATALGLWRAGWCQAQGDRHRASEPRGWAPLFAGAQSGEGPVLHSHGLTRPCPWVPGGPFR